ENNSRGHRDQRVQTRTPQGVQRIVVTENVGVVLPADIVVTTGQAVVVGEAEPERVAERKQRQEDESQQPRRDERIKRPGGIAFPTLRRLGRALTRPYRVADNRGRHVISSFPCLRRGFSVLLTASASFPADAPLSRPLTSSWLREASIALIEMYGENFNTE